MIENEIGSSAAMAMEDFEKEKTSTIKNKMRVAVCVKKKQCIGVIVVVT